MKRLISTFSIILYVVLIMQPQIAFAANKINSMDISIELQEDGSAVVQEERQMTVDDGTELYIEMNNLQDSEVIDFSVEGFTYDPDWDSGDSLEEKSGYYGVIQKGEDSELVWGMGEHGEKIYRLTYTLTNAVRQLEDGQALLWNFDTFLGIPTESLEVSINSPSIRFNQENTNFWGYGFDGDLQMQANQIVWTSYESLDSSNHVTVLLQFPSSPFETQASVDMTLEEQRQMANEGSSYNQSHESDDSFYDWIPLLIFAFIGIPGFIIFILVIVWSMKVQKLKRQNNAMVTGAKRIKKNADRTNLSVPDYGDDIANLAFLLQELHVGSFEDYFAAYLIKWLSEERIRIETFTTKKFFGEKYTTYIYINDFDQMNANPSKSFIDWLYDDDEDSTIEEGMWLMLLDASDSQGEVDSVLIQSWGHDHVDEVNKFDELLIEKSMRYLSDQGYFNFVEETVWRRPVQIVQSTPSGEALFDHLAQHLNYLDSAMIRGTDKADPALSQMIIWSLIGGISTKVNKQFEDILPMKEAYNEDSHYYDDSMTYYWYSTMNFRNDWSTGLSSGGYNSTVVGSGSDGSGGSTSSGGGGGAGGGGGGGAR